MSSPRGIAYGRRMTTPVTLDDLARQLDNIEALIEECLTIVRNRRAGDADVQLV